jgi:hypothetical protein
LFDVRIGQLFDGFGLEENLIPDDEVRVIIVRQGDSFVADFLIFFARKRNCGATQFDEESILVDDFVVALPQLAVNLHAKTHELKNFLFMKQFFQLRYELQ